MKADLEFRMYGLVPYNISEIQKAIQFGHAVVEYGQKVKKKAKIGNSPAVNWEQTSLFIKNYDEWADKWKTFIILNGGTSNHSKNRYIQNEDFLGTMEDHLKKLNEIGIETAEFYEPDLNDMLSAIVFIVDERVFNKKDYPDFEDWVIHNYGDLIQNNSEKSDYELANMMRTSESEFDKKIFNEWIDLIGGFKNSFLKDFLKNFKLA